MKTGISRRMTAVLSILLLPLVLSACDALAGGPEWMGTSVDSAGITMVSNPESSMWRDGDAWTLEEDLSIGTVAGEPEYQFGQIGGFDVDAAGNLYVLDIQAQEVRVFDAQGGYVRTLGGPGGGPGEIGMPAVGIFIRPDGTVAVPDIGNQRVNLYDADGNPAGENALDLTGGIPLRWSLFTDGRLMAQLRGLDIPGIDALEGGDPIVIYGADGSVEDTLMTLPKGESIELSNPNAPQIKLFVPEPLWDMADDGTIFTAMNDDYRVKVHSADAAVTRIITKPFERKPVSEMEKAAIRSAVEEQMVTLGAPPQAVQVIMQGLTIGDYYPAFGLLGAGPSGSVWVQRIKSAADMAEGEAEDFNIQNVGSPEWEVFDAEGRYLGVVVLPDRFTPAMITEDLVYGIWLDELDVQYVKRLRIVRPDA